MADRLRDLERMIESIQQLSAIVSAYRGIAAARLREAEDRLAGVRGYAESIGGAIGLALGMAAEREGLGQALGQTGASRDRPPGSHLVITLCSEQGFVAGFNRQVLDQAEAALAAPPLAGARLILVGSRGLALAEERALTVDWSAPMAAHAEEVAGLGNRLADALYERIEQHGVTRVSIVHAVPGKHEAEVTTRSLLPFDFGRFAVRTGPIVPIIDLPFAQLVVQLAEEYVFAELCEAVMLSYAAENQARMMAMLAVRGNVRDRLGALQAQARRMRQEEITAEVVELAAGAQAQLAAGDGEA